MRPDKYAAACEKMERELAKFTRSYFAKLRTTRLPALVIGSPYPNNTFLLLESIDLPVPELLYRHTSNEPGQKGNIYE